MKKLQKMVPLFLLMCLFSLAAGCGSDKGNTDPEDMAGNTVTESRPDTGADGTDASAPSETEAFDGSETNPEMNSETNPETNSESLNNSVTDPTANAVEESASTSTDTGNVMDDAADTAGNLAKNEIGRAHV